MTFKCSYAVNNGALISFEIKGTKKEAVQKLKEKATFALKKSTDFAEMILRDELGKEIMRKNIYAKDLPWAKMIRLRF